MRNLFALVGAAIVTFGGIGWYLDWYKIKQSPEVQGHTSVNIDFNKDKIVKDVNSGVKKGEEKLQHVLDKTKDAQKSVNQQTSSVPQIDIKPEIDFSKVTGKGE